MVWRIFITFTAALTGLPVREPQEPVHLKAGESTEVHIWRCVGATKVWYEWASSAPCASHIHNVNGRSYHVGL